MAARLHKAWGWFSLVVLLWTSSSQAGEGIDPLNNFCDRWYHQSQISGDVLIISGGLESFRDRSDIQNQGQGNLPNETGVITAGPNNYIITIEMGSSWDWKTNISETATLVKKSPSTGTLPPIVQNAALFHGGLNDETLYLYGGVTPTINTSFPNYQTVTADQYTLWGLDPTTDVWQQYSVFGGAPERPSWGARTDAEDLALAFYFNGMVSNESSITSQSLGDETIFLESMVVLNLTSHLATNLSTLSATNGSPRIGSEMVYISGLGTEGILIVIGGASGSPERLSLSSMEEILIFDVNSVLGNTTADGWYTQRTSGAAPDPRIDFCAVLVAAPDNSSYSIYIYGGWDPTLTHYYDEIWILTLPSFTWIHAYTGDSPRFGHTCHLVGNRQMITIGGLLQSNYSTTNCDWEYMGVAILDLSEFIWGSVFDANAAPYQVFSNISEVIGGDANGSAKALLPSGGWSNVQLASLMTGSANTSAPVPKNRASLVPEPVTTSSPSPSSPAPTLNASHSPSSNSSSSSVNTKAIIGGICGAVVVFVLAGLLYFLYKMKAKRRYETMNKDGTFDATRPKAPFEMEEMHDKGHGPYNDAGPREMPVAETRTEMPGSETRPEMPGSEARPEILGSAKLPIESGGGAVYELGTA